MRLRTVLTPLAGLALSAAMVTGISPVQTLPEAAAAPKVTRKASYSSSDGDFHSKKMKSQLRALDKMYSAATDKKSGMKINYAKMDKADGGHVTWRRELAAGYIMGGGIVTNISKAERKKVYAEIPGRYKGCQVCVSPAGAAPSDVTLAPDPGTKGCTGRNDKNWKYKGSPIFVHWVDANLYLNSCETDLLQRNMTYTAVAFGIIAVVCGISVIALGYGIAFGIASGLLAMGANEVDYRQKRSNKDAVVFKVRYTLNVQLRSQ
jgi:hypothetical protein